MNKWLMVADKILKEYRPLFEALRAYDFGASEEEIKKILGLKEL